MIAKKSFMMMAIRLSGLSLTFAVNVIIARTVGEKGFGLYAYIYSWLLIAYASMTLGLQTVSLKMVGEYMAGRQWGLLRGYVKYTQVALALFSTAAAGCILLFSISLDDKIYGARWEFAAAALLLPLYAMFMFRMFLLQSLGKSIEAYLLGLVIRPLLLVILVAIGFYAMGITFNVLTLVLLDIPSIVLSLLVITYFIRKAMPPECLASEPITETRRWIDLAKPIYLSAGFGVALSQMDIILLGMFAVPQEDLGVFAAATKLAVLIPMGAISVNAVAVPVISRQWAEGKMDDLQETVSRMSLFVILVTMPIILVIIFGGEFFLSIFGESFTRGYTVLLIIATGQVINAFVGPVGYIMNVTRLQWHASMVMFSTVLLDLTLNMFLIPAYGITGAAISFSVSMIFCDVAIFIVVANKLGIYSFPFMHRRVANES